MKGMLRQRPLETIKEKKELADYAVPDAKPKLDTYEDDPINERDLFPGAYFADSLETYYTTYAKKVFFKEDLQSLMPINLSLEVYGMNGLQPGNVFNIDYLPDNYREKVFFHITSIGHTVDETGWVTKIDSAMRLNITSKKKW